jgi:Fe-S-cluster containining protein
MLKTSKESISMRPCGDCQLCCKLFPVPLLDKPAGSWCRYSCSGGCAIHGSRPEICRQYDCYWREHDELREECRPDRIGVVVTESGNVSVGRHSIPVVTFQEDFARAANGPEAAAMLARFVQQGFAVLVIHGPDARTVFDRDRYPNVSAEEIEAALLHEFSQEADELRRLGAVDDSHLALFSTKFAQLDGR